MFKVNNKDTRTTPLADVSIFYPCKGQKNKHSLTFPASREMEHWGKIG